MTPLQKETLRLTLQQKWQSLRPHLNEKTRRLWAVTEIQAIGRGGLKLVHQATNLSQTTLRRALREQEREPQEPETTSVPGPTGGRPGRIRRPGGGRKQRIEQDPTLQADLESLVAPGTRGDPQTPLCWSCKSTTKLAAQLQAMGHLVSADTVGRLLKQSGYSLQASRKVKEGDSHPDRDAQFAYINERTTMMQQAALPVISIDCKKKELVGEFKNAGREWHPKGEPEAVRVHDFLDKDRGKAIPYGVFDVTRNRGWVSVGVDHDTAEFAVATITRWWEQVGKKMYPEAQALQIMGDGGGSNSSRSRLFKVALQRFADAAGLTVHVCHFPPGTSKWNKIEHRMFSYISLNWRGRPLISHEVIVSLIGSTTTRTGLRIDAALDPNPYPTRIAVTDAALAQVNLHRHAFHGEWNYTILPRM